MTRRPGQNRSTLSRARREADALAAGVPLPPRRVQRPRHIENDEQAALFTWAEHAQCTMPELELLYAIPNGGKRDSREAGCMRRQGTKPGVPDLDLPMPRPRSNVQGSFYCGLRIEMKRTIVKGEDRPRTSLDQAKWLTRLQRAGHCCCLCFGSGQAIESITAYLRSETVPNQWQP